MTNELSCFPHKQTTLPQMELHHHSLKTVASDLVQPHTRQYDKNKPFFNSIAPL